MQELINEVICDISEKNELEKKIKYLLAIIIGGLGMNGRNRKDKQNVGTIIS